VKKMWKLVILPLLAIALAAAVFSVRKTDDPATKGGGITNNTDPNAPKIISSTEITSFDCAFTTANSLNPGRLGRCFYSFHAVIQNGKTVGSYRSEVRSSSDETVNGAFDTDISFMAELQSIVAKHDLAKYNGLSYHVGGLPPKLGGKLFITYASGEKISAVNNQSNIFSVEDMETLEALFHKAAFENTEEDKI